MTTIKRIVITPGEPAGIGPDVLIKAAQMTRQHDWIAVADPTLLITRAKQLGLPLQLIEADFNHHTIPHHPGTLAIVPVALHTDVVAGHPDPGNARYVLKTLETAASLCLQKTAHSLVTGPVHKGVINEAGIAFSGHTEFFAEYCKIPLTVMLFVVDHLKVALVTTHLPLKDVARAITRERLQTTLAILTTSLKQQFGIDNPRIMVCGLNPHAGEDGHLGREEIDTLIPAIKAAQAEGLNIQGPLPADTIFIPGRLEETDTVLAMYHDQVLPLIKYLGFDRAVNVTLGLPFIRTSVDHGTALEIAGSGHANPGSLLAAIRLGEKNFCMSS